eukprot:1619853-Rhodomonas_salina.1
MDSTVSSKKWGWPGKTVGTCAQYVVKNDTKESCVREIGNSTREPGYPGTPVLQKCSTRQYPGDLTK